MRNRKRSNTCLAVLRDTTGKLWFAGDRRISWDNSQIIKSPVPKIILKDNILLSGTGDCWVCALIINQFKIPLRPRDITPYDYLSKIFVPKLLDWLKRENYIDKDERGLRHKHYKNDDYDPSALILVGIDSDLFELDITTDNIVFDYVDCPYGAGCGGFLAWGSLLTTEKMKMKPQERLRLALRVAAQVSSGCDDNIDILHN